MTWLTGFSNSFFSSYTYIFLPTQIYMIFSFLHLDDEMEFNRYVELIKNYKDSGQFVLSHPEIPLHTRHFLAEQIEAWSKGYKKHPDMVASGCVFTLKALEQSTSQKLARLKSTLLWNELGLHHTTVQTVKVVDLTGGLGAETIAYAQMGAQVDYVDTSQKLCEMMHYNARKLHIASQIHIHHCSAEAFLQNADHDYDLMLVDPDRRASGVRSLHTDTFSPDVYSLERQILSLARYMVVKHSPMTDITFIKKRFNSLVHIGCLSVSNDVKEVMSVHASPINKSFDVMSKPSTFAIAMDASGSYFFYESNQQEQVEGEQVSQAETYIYEPDKSLVKSGLSDGYFYGKGMKKIKGSAYFTSHVKEETLMGRGLQVLYQAPFNKKTIKSQLAQLHHPKISVGSSLFILKNPTIEKELNLVPGSDFRLLCWGKKPFTPFYIIGVPIVQGKR
jgi:16S rRNA G966 N2-methylase RsmD